jgi:hypothetical protein
MTPGTYKIVSVAGQTLITNLPTQDRIHIDARVVGGQICINGVNASDGLGNHVQRDFGTLGMPAINLQVRQVFGQIQIGSAGCSRR